jgi:hypothetical protein
MITVKTMPNPDCNPNPNPKERKSLRVNTEAVTAALEFVSPSGSVATLIEEGDNRYLSGKSKG